MKKLVAIAALSVGFAFTAQADDLSDYLDSQYEISWATETQFEQFHSTGIVDPLLAYQTEGEQLDIGSPAATTGPVVDIAVMEIVGKPLSNEDSVLFVETYE